MTYLRATEAVQAVFTGALVARLAYPASAANAGAVYRETGSAVLTAALLGAVQPERSFRTDFQALSREKEEED